MKVKLLDSTTNRVVVHVEGRNYPGIVFQGDELSGMAMNANECFNTLMGLRDWENVDMQNADEETIKLGNALFAIGELRSTIEHYREHYDKVCSK